MTQRHKQPLTQGIFPILPNCNSKLKSTEILFHPDGTFDMIRRAEKLGDYFATFDFCDVMKEYQ